MSPLRLQIQNKWKISTIALAIVIALILLNVVLVPEKLNLVRYRTVYVTMYQPVTTTVVTPIPTTIYLVNTTTVEKTTYITRAFPVTITAFETVNIVKTKTVVYEHTVIMPITVRKTITALPPPPRVHLHDVSFDIDPDGYPVMKVLISVSGGAVELRIETPYRSWRGFVEGVKSITLRIGPRFGTPLIGDYIVSAWWFTGPILKKVVKVFEYNVTSILMEEAGGTTLLIKNDGVLPVFVSMVNYVLENGTVDLVRMDRPLGVSPEHTAMIELPKGVVIARILTSLPDGRLLVLSEATRKGVGEVVKTIHGRLGETIHVGDLLLTVEKVVETETVFYNGYTYYAGDGMKYVVIRLKIENIGNITHSTVELWNIKLITDGGGVYKGKVVYVPGESVKGVTVGAYDIKLLRWRTIPPSTSVEGDIVFVVPEDERPVVLSIKIGFLKVYVVEVSLR